MNAQLRMMVGVKMAVATDALLGVTEGAMPDPTKVATLPFVRDHTVVILSHLHEFLNHEADGLPCLLPDACMVFLRECQEAVDRGLKLSHTEVDTDMPPHLQQQIDSVSVWIMCVAIPYYRDAWEQLASVETSVGTTSDANTIVGDLEFEVNSRRFAEANAGGELFNCTYLADFVVYPDKIRSHHSSNTQGHRCHRGSASGMPLPS